jgi:hypothetical protein
MNPFSPPKPNDTQWPLHDMANPLDGWDLQEVMAVNNGPAVNDIFGKLHHYVKDKLSQFLGRLATQDFAFHFSHIEASELPKLLGDQRFDRIETSNIAGSKLMGIRPVVSSLGPLLRPRKENPHATLITTFTSAIRQTCDQIPDVILALQDDQIFKYTGRPKAIGDAASISAMLFAPLLRDSERYFSRYCYTVFFHRSMIR